MRMCCTGGAASSAKGGDGVSGPRQEAGVGGEPARRVGAEDRAADAGDRFFKACLAESRGVADAASHESRGAIYEQIVREREKTEAGKEAMTVQAMCGSAGVSRAGYYRHCGRPEVPDEHTELRDAIQKVALEWPAYGRRRVTAELKRRGWQVNHKRVHRMMREDNLLCLRRRRFLA